MNIKNVEENLGIDIEIFLKAVINGIWSKKHLGLSDPYKQKCRFPVMLKKDYNNAWRFYFKPSSPCGDSEYGPAHIFWETVLLSDYGKTWAVTKKVLQK